MDQIGARCWPEWARQMQGGALLVPLCAAEKSIAARPAEAAPRSQTPQRVQRNAPNTPTR